MLYDAVLTKLIGKFFRMYVTGSIRDQIEVLCGLVQMIQDDVLT
jgi:hypothetical protein